MDPAGVTVTVGNRDNAIQLTHLDAVPPVRGKPRRPAAVCADRA